MKACKKKDENDKDSKDLTYVLGLEHFIDKIGYQAEAYESRGIKTHYFVNDKTGFSSQKAKQYNANVTIIPAQPMRRLKFILSRFKEKRPSYVELYHTGLFTAIYSIISTVFGAKLVFILRGQEFEKKRSIMSCTRYAGLIVTLILADKVIAKEANLQRSAEKIIGVRRKLYVLGNAVPIPKNTSSTKDIDLLYLNSIRRERDIGVVISALGELKKRGHKVNSILIGFHTLNSNHTPIDKEAEMAALDQIHTEGLTEDIQIMGFVPDPHVYHARAKIFCFPSNIIFANYSLLEAMAHGSVPLVTHGEGATGLVEDGINGYILTNDPMDWTEKILDLLNDQALRERLSRSSRVKIRNEFSIANWVDRLVEIRSCTLKR